MWDDNAIHYIVLKQLKWNISFLQNTLIKSAHSQSLNLVKQVSNFQRKLISRGTALSRSISPSSLCPNLFHPLRQLSMPGLGSSYCRLFDRQEEAADTSRALWPPPSWTGLKSELPLSPGAVQWQCILVTTNSASSLLMSNRSAVCSEKLWLSKRRNGLG